MMPTLLRVEGFRFFFYSNERQEPPHVHVEKGDGEAKLLAAAGAARLLVSADAHRATALE